MIESESLPYPIGALRACWEAAARLGYERRAVRDCIVVRSVTHEPELTNLVDEEFENYWSGPPRLPRTDHGEVIQ